MDPQGKSAAGLQMVGAVRKDIFGFTTQLEEAEIAIPRPTESMYLSDGKSYLNQQSQGKYA